MKKSTSKTRLNKIYCLVGPSGTGKSALIQRIPLPSVISYRTRNKRDGEVNGIDGHFISKEQFLEMDKDNLWIAKTDYAGNYYGITQGEILELEDKPMVYVIDWNGVITLKESFSKLQGYDPSQIASIFIHTPREDLESRMIIQGRRKDEIRARLDRADRDYSASGKCDYLIENRNDEIENAAYEIMKIILETSFAN